MPEPLTAWAAVAPDGTIGLFCIRHTKRQANELIGSYERRAGWRVVQVEIRVKEDTDHGA